MIQKKGNVNISEHCKAEGKTLCVGMSVIVIYMGVKMSEVNEEQKFLNEYDIDQYERPSVAADMAVFTIMQEEALEGNSRKLPEKKLKLLLIKRGNPPYKDMWALPGGFLKKGETIYDTARRELKEETGTDKAYLEMCYTFSEQGRDPRGWIISQAFMALVNSDVDNRDMTDGEEDRGIRAGSDAKEAKWFDVILEKLDEGKTTYEKTGNTGVKSNIEIEVDITYRLKLISRNIMLTAIVSEHKQYKDYHEIVDYMIVETDGIAFDHAKMITCILNKLRKAVETDAKLAFDLMPEYFTLTDLQTAVEIILDKELLKPNFRRKIAEYVVKTDEQIMDGGHRPSYLYKRNVTAFYSDKFN